MSEEHTCGQCELYLPVDPKCPHPSRYAFSKGCDIFEYTNPIGRIDGMLAVIADHEATIAAQALEIERLKKRTHKYKATLAAACLRTKCIDCGLPKYVCKFT